MKLIDPGCHHPKNRNIIGDLYSHYYIPIFFGMNQVTGIPCVWLTSQKIMHAKQAAQAPHSTRIITSDPDGGACECHVCSGETTGGVTLQPRCWSWSSLVWCCPSFFDTTQFHVDKWWPDSLGQVHIRWFECFPWISKYLGSISVGIGMICNQSRYLGPSETILLSEWW